MAIMHIPSVHWLIAPCLPFIRISTISISLSCAVFISCSNYHCPVSYTHLLAAMYATDSLSLNKRMLALTECAVYPDPDIMARDNAMWLWTAMWNGKYLINESGELTGDYISVEQLKKFYNHEATVTRDEIGKQEE